MEELILLHLYLTSYLYFLHWPFPDIQSPMSTVVNCCRNTSVRFVYCTATAMHTRSICLAGCARILRFMLSVLTKSMRYLPRTQISTALNSSNDSCDNEPNSHASPATTQSCDEPPLAGCITHDACVLHHIERAQSMFGLFPDRYGDVARSSASYIDNFTRDPRPPLPRLGRVRIGLKSSVGPTGELVLSSTLTRLSGRLPRWSTLLRGAYLEPPREERERQTSLYTGGGVHHRVTTGSLGPSWWLMLKASSASMTRLIRRILGLIGKHALWALVDGLQV